MQSGISQAMRGRQKILLREQLIILMRASMRVALCRLIQKLYKIK